MYQKDGYISLQELFLFFNKSFVDGNICDIKNIMAEQKIVEIYDKDGNGKCKLASSLRIDNNWFDIFRALTCMQKTFLRKNEQHITIEVKNLEHQFRPLCRNVLVEICLASNKFMPYNT